LIAAIARARHRPDATDRVRSPPWRSRPPRTPRLARDADGAIARARAFFSETRRSEKTVVPTTDNARAVGKFMMIIRLRSN